jgi:ribosomal protein L32
MGDTNGRMRLIAIIGTVSGLAALFWVVSLFDFSKGSLSVGAAGPDLFVGLLVFGVLAVAAVSWFALTRKSAHREDTESYVECASCGRSILRDWRLCPYCGVRVEPERVSDGPARASS